MSFQNPLGSSQIFAGKVMHDKMFMLIVKKYLSQ